MSSSSEQEPWLRGPIDGVHPLLAPVLYAYEQAREDVHRWTEGLTDAQMWEAPQGLGPVGFHVRHIGGSLERLLTYAEGRQLTTEQIAAMKLEKEPGEARQDLLRRFDDALDRAAALVRRIRPATLTDAREVGRKKLPSTVAGLLIHTTEHTQRHVGEIIVTAKIVKAAL